MSSRGSSEAGAATTKARTAPGLVVDADLTVLEFLGQAGPYVEFASGAADLQLSKVVHPAIRKSVAKAALRVFDTGDVLRRRGVRFYRDGKLRRIDITVVPTAHPKSGDSCVEIRFEEVAGRESHPESQPAPASSPQSAPAESREYDLEEEVATLNRELEAKATAHDEMRRLFAARLLAVEEQKEKSLAELEQAYAELEANHEELQIVVSEKEQAELQEREERDFIAAVLDAAEALVVVLDRRGRIVRFNRAAERAAGAPLGRIRNGLIWSLIPADQRTRVKQAFDDLMSGRFPNCVENDWIRQDGTRVRVAWSNTVLKTSGGTVTHVVGVGVDVTEQRKGEAALRDSEARNRALVEGAPLGVVAIARDNRIRAVNAGLERMFGYERAELLGRPLDVLLPERFRSVQHSHQERFFEHPLNRPMGVDLALFGRAKDGREFPIEVGLGYFDAADGPYAVAFVTDVTEKVQAHRTIEQNRDEIRDLAARLMTAKEDEQSRIARELHDGLVQELVALKLDLAVLARNPATAEAGLLEDLRTAETRAGRAAESARSISHKVHPATLEKLGLVPALRANAAQVRRSRGIDVRVDADGPIPTLPRDVALGLYRISQEALWNAAAHSGADQVTITLRIESGRLKLEVIDQGKGFDFARVRGGRSLGLVSMEERARLIHAELRIESRRKGGTIVSVGLNLEQLV